MNGRARFGSISGDGRYVSFTATMADVDLMGPPCPSLFCGLNEVFRYDRVTQTTLRTSWPLFGGFPDDSSETQYIMHSAISDDGSSVVYTSYASNFIAGDTVGSPDIFVTDYL